MDIAKIFQDARRDPTLQNTLDLAAILGEKGGKSVSTTSTIYTGPPMQLPGDITTILEENQQVLEELDPPLPTKLLQIGRAHV